jgi:heat shock protein 4
MREKIGESAELGPFISSEDRDTFGKMLEEIEEWLYSDKADEGTKVAQVCCTTSCPSVIAGCQVTFCNKLDQLKTHGSPLEAAASFRAALETYKSFVTSVNSGDEKYEHITAEQAQKVSSNCNEAEIWLKDKMNAQKTDEIKSRMTALQVQCHPIVNTPKPAPPEVKMACARARVCVCVCVCVCVSVFLGFDSFSGNKTHSFSFG